MGILAVGSELIHVDAQLDRQKHVTKLLDVFRDFANASNNDILLCIAIWRSAVGQYSKGMVDGYRNSSISKNMYKNSFGRHQDLCTLIMNDTAFIVCFYSLR
jgi:hypothetical protein